MSLPSPPSPDALADLPAIEADPNSTWYRIFRAFDAGTGVRREPLLFSASGQGRFDPPGAGHEPAAPPPYGTCYFGASLLAAYVEKFGDFGVLRRAQVHVFQVIAVQPAEQRRLADVSDGRLLGQFGLTKEICATDDYSGPQAWSLALFRAGFDGIAYAPRRDPVGDLRAVALFGPPGPAEVGQVGLSHAQEGPIPECAIVEAASRYHLFCDLTAWAFAQGCQDSSGRLDRSFCGVGCITNSGTMAIAQSLFRGEFLGNHYRPFPWSRGWRN